MLGNCLKGINDTSLLDCNYEIWGNLNEYTDDFKKIVFERESYRTPFRHRSPQLSYRTELVVYMKKTATKLKLTHCCLHLSIYLLDIFMDNHFIEKEQLFLIANTCLLIAAKFEEITAAIPKIKELNAQVNNVYPLQDYKIIESVLLKFYKWYVMFPTVAHFVSYFLRALICVEDLEKIGKPELLYEMNFVIKVLMDKTIDNVHYIQFLPSKLGAAIICAARKQIGLPGWNSLMLELTQYSQDDIKNELIALTQDDYLKCSICMDLYN